VFSVTTNPSPSLPPKFGEIPNKFALQFCASPILVLTCSVDVHKDNLAVAVFGWCRGRRCFLIDYWRFEGDTQQLDDAGSWGRLRELLERHEYRADDGKSYRIQMCLIDSGYLTDQVYQFAASYEIGVFPVKGRELSPKNARQAEFQEFETPMGTRAFGVTVDIYKDRWSASLKRSWDAQEVQPQGHFNAPIDITDAQLKELTVEVKREKIEKTTGKRVGFEWHRPSGAANELWDVLIYSNAALDVIGWDLCRSQLDMQWVNWTAFWDLAEAQQPYFTSG
jgi:phage terminase large subunit GpA-like protein